jgi:glycosyltransferase involved in cell wall biosynthesis
MKILLLHNFYRSDSPSGENQVFEMERALLQKHGHDVRLFTRHSDELTAQGALGKIKGAVSVPWNPFSARALRKTIREFQPDVMHAHNTFPLLSPAVFPAARGTARVLTLHNYRLFCAAAIPMRDGQICTECLDQRSVRPALRHNCYRGGKAATVPLAANIALHRFRGTWENDVEAFIALSEFQREKFVVAGLPADRVQVKPNFYAGNPEVVPWDERADRVVFVGRLSAEKGVHTLLRAWSLWGDQVPPLRIVGDGELRRDLEEQARGLPVEFIGQVGPKEAQAEIAQARLVVLPSEWFEGFPMVLREAFAFGTPSAVSNIGPLPGLVRDPESGCTFEPANPESLLHAVRSAWEDPERLERWSRGARAAFEAKYTEDANYEMLMAIYEQAMEGSERARHAGSLRSA